MLAVHAVNSAWVAVSLIVFAAGIAGGVYLVYRLNKRFFSRSRREDDGRPARREDV